jgi:hypothetical protein
MMVAAAIAVQEVAVVAAADQEAGAACQVSAAYEEEHHTWEGRHRRVEEGAFQAWEGEDQHQEAGACLALVWGGQLPWAEEDLSSSDGEAPWEDPFAQTVEVGASQVASEVEGRQAAEDHRRVRTAEERLVEGASSGDAPEDLPAATRMAVVAQEDALAFGQSNSWGARRPAEQGALRSGVASCLAKGLRLL